MFEVGTSRLSRGTCLVAKLKQQRVHALIQRVLLVVRGCTVRPNSSVSSCEDKGAQGHLSREELHSEDSPASPAGVCPTMHGEWQSEGFAGHMNDKTLLRLQNWCSDRDSRCWRILLPICCMTIFSASLALFVLWAFVLFPFQKPEMGFWGNWMFNFVAHPVANYIVARGVIGWFARQILWDLESRPSLCKAQRPEITRQVERSLHLAPIADSLWCASEHVLLSFANVYPIPFSTVLSCGPAAFVSMGVFYLLLPKEVRALQSTVSFAKFTSSSWSAYFFVYAGMLFYTAFFSKVEMGVQLAMSFALSTIELTLATISRALGTRWNIPVHLVREMRTGIKLPVIIFKASMLSEAKGIWVFLSLVLPEAVQILGSVGLVLFDLLSNNGETEQALAMANIRNIRSTQQVAQTCRTSYRGLKGVRRRLKEIAQSCEQISKKDLHQISWAMEDIKLLNEVSSSLSAVVMLEVCEIMAPLIYICLLLCLQSSTFLGHNSSYFLGLADANLEESLIANSYSLLLEVILLLVTELCMRAVIGMSFCSFIGFVLRCDFSFWLSTLSMAYVGWLTMLVQHTGHDFKFQFSWLP